MNSWDIQNWFKEHVVENGKPFILDRDQAEAVLDDHKNTIITARAGSGKTRVIVAKIVYLIAHEGYDPDEIIAFAFNTKARDELNDRLSKIEVDGEHILPDNLDKYSQIATTFHSFAARARGLGGEILSDKETDDKEKQGFVPNREYFIQRIIKEKLNKNKILQFVRDSGNEQKGTTEDTVGEDELLLAREEGYYETLNGEIVKSFGEKIIADYLFEHGIDYRYEKYNLYPAELVRYAKDSESAEKLKARNSVRPDFYLEESKLIWEHWGIRGDESAEEISAINRAKVFDGGYEAYSAGKKWKEWFYSRDWLNRAIGTDLAKIDKYYEQVLDYKGLIATHKNLFETREDFEKQIEEKLAEYGIYNEKLPEEVIIAKLLNNKNREVIDRLTEQITGFIDKAEHGFLSNYDELRALCKEEKDQHVSLFYELALETLDYYTNELTCDPSDEKQRPLLNSSFEKIYTTDFNILLDAASHRIREKKENPRLKVDGYRFIFIDEYQDFSNLFYNLIKALRERSESANMMVVGDDWQAINGYAGSDLKFFEDFEEYFPEDCNRLQLLTNYRSSERIVELSNEFMKKAGISGEGSEAFNDFSVDDALQICQITGFKRKNNKKSKRKYIEQLYDLTLAEIIKQNKNKTIAILSRKKKARAYPSLVSCEKTLRKYFESEDEEYGTNLTDDYMNENFSISTVNSAKGCEADVVIILETDNGSFPVIHPDTKLYRVFGEDESKMIDEQKRLFYVALTRPKEKLYILHEKEFSDENTMDENFLTMLDKDELDSYVPQPKDTQSRIVDEEISTFIAVGIESYPNKRRPQNQDYVITARNGDRVRQFNVDSFRDRESCEIFNTLSDFFRRNPEGEYRVWAEVQNKQWIHFRKQRPSDGLVNASYSW